MVDSVRGHEEALFFNGPSYVFLKDPNAEGVHPGNKPQVRKGAHHSPVPHPKS